MFSWLSKTIYGEEPEISPKKSLEDSPEDSLEVYDPVARGGTRVEETSTSLMTDSLLSHIQERAPEHASMEEMQPIVSAPAELTELPPPLVLRKFHPPRKPRFHFPSAPSSPIKFPFLDFDNLPELSFKPEEKETDSKRPTPLIMVLLDESGSMAEYHNEMVDALNGFIADQKTVSIPAGGKGQGETDCLFSMATFDNNYRVIIESTKLSEVKPLKYSDYKPGGCTALYDAIGETITAHGDKKNVILVIVTDGLDNSSQKYSRRQIAGLIDKYKDQGTYAWSIIYLAANPFLLEQSAGINISNRHAGTSSCQVEFAGMKTFMTTTFSRAVTAYRSGSTKTVNLSSTTI